MKKKFIDRKDIQKQLLDDIKLSAESNKVVILSAGQGIGKSELTKVISKRLQSHIVFRVSTRFFSGKGVSPGTYYKSFVKSAISLREKGDLPSFVDFLRSKPKETVSRFLAGIVKAASTFDPISSKIVSFSNSISKLTDKDLGNLISSRNIEVQLNFSSYIVNSIKEKRVLLIVENAQCIDEEFIDFMSLLLNNSKNVYCILEYTKNVQATLEESELYEVFSENCHACEKLRLEKLPSSYALQIVSSNDKESLGVIKEYYEKSDGNLKPLQQMSEYRGVALSNTLQSIPKSKYGIEVVTINAFKELKDDEKYILSIINLVDGFISINEIKLIIESDIIDRQNYSLRSCLENLERAEFIEIISDHISLKDDVSFRKVGSDSYLGRYEQIALSSLKKYYNSDCYLSDSSAPEEIILKKLKVMINLDDNSEISYLANESIKQASLSNSPWLYIKPISDWLIKESYSNAWYILAKKILLASVNFGEYHMASELINAMRKTQGFKEEDSLIYALILLKTNRPSDCLNEIDSISFDNDAEKYSLEIKAEVIKLTAYYYMSKFKKAECIYNNLIRHAFSKESIDKGFILSCSPMINIYSESVLDLKEAVSIFEKYSMPISTSRAKNKLAIDLARMGEFDRAEVLIEDASDVLLVNKIDRYIILNNIEAIKLQKGFVDEVFFEVLNDLLITVSGVYEKVIINNNLMLAYILAGEPHIAIEHAEKILKILNSGLYIDNGIRWTLKNNFIFLESKLSTSDAFISSQVKGIKLSSLPKHKLCKSIDSGYKDFKSSGESYYAEMDYRAMYLSHWTIEF